MEKPLSLKTHAQVAEVVAVEYDPDANLNARENLQRNGVEARVQLVERMADPELLATFGPKQRQLGEIDANGLLADTEEAADRKDECR